MGTSPQDTFNLDHLPSSGIFRTVNLQPGSKVIIKPYLPNNGVGNAVDLSNGGAMPGTPILVQAYTRAINQQVKNLQYPQHYNFWQ